VALWRRLALLGFERWSAGPRRGGDGLALRSHSTAMSVCRICPDCGLPHPRANAREPTDPCPRCGAAWLLMVEPAPPCGFRPGCGALLTASLLLFVAGWLVSFWVAVCGGIGADYLLTSVVAAGCLLALRASHGQLAQHLPPGWALGLTVGLIALLAASWAALLAGVLSGR